MIRGPLAALFVALLVGGLVLLAPEARADETQTLRLDAHEALPTSQRVRAEVLGTQAGNRHGGYGYVRVKLTNPDDKAHDIRLSLVSSFVWFNEDRSAQRVVRRVRLEPGERATLFLPLVNTYGGSTLRAHVNGVRMPDEASFSTSGNRASPETSVLAVWKEDPQRGFQWVQALEKLAPPSRRGGRALYLQTRVPDQLPDQWVLLSGFDLVLADLRAPGLTTEHEQLLLRYVEGGGALVLLSAPTSGPLADMLADADGARSGFRGLGRWYVSEDPTQNRKLDAWLRADMEGGEYGVLQSATRNFSGSMPTPFWLPLEIPGLGEVPVKAFFLLILAFAIVVGPLNYIYFRRRRSLPMLLITIPALGFACTLVILLYGTFSEGFGVIGARRTFSVLDQRHHTASVCTGQTLYAGLQPSELEPTPGAFFCSSAFQLEGQDRGPSTLFRVNLDRGYVVEGAALPSRTPTPFLTVNVARARDRLRFRRRPDGHFDVLAAPGFLPVEAEGAVILRTWDGAMYVMDAGGVLRPQVVELKGQVLPYAGVTKPLVDMPVGAGMVSNNDQYSWRRYRFRTAESMESLVVGPESVGRWLTWRLPTLEKGTYLARMQQAPIDESLGLDVDYRADEHIVYGILDQEDVIDD